MTEQNEQEYLSDPYQLGQLRSKSRSFKKVHRKALKRLPQRKDLNMVMQELHHEAFEQIDCLQCANCCRTTGPLFTQRDIERIANALGMKPGEFIDQYLREDEDGDLVLQILPCPFLNLSDNRCGIYEVRPKACRAYPHTDQRNQAGIWKLTLANASICPAVFQMLQKVINHKD